VQVAMIQDMLMPLDDVHPAYLDRAMFYGDGVYEVVRGYQGRLFALDAHMTRFANSLEAVDIEGIVIGDIRNRVIRAYEHAHIEDAVVYFHVTRGSGFRSLASTPEMEPNFFMTITSTNDRSDAKKNGIAVITHPDHRWKLCHIKSLNLLPNVLARRDAAQKGCQEAILVNEQGCITEGASSAFFAIVGSAQGHPAMRTAPLTANILPSVTRTYVLKAASHLDLPVVEESFTPEEAAEARELFIASTTQDIVPVVQFDGIAIGDGEPGSKTRQLMQTFSGFTAV
jgi:D-alanine transaminase